jgi:uncharacterized protein YbjQ (UPF0145 family)
MLITTTDNLQGYRIDRYLGIVSGQSVIGEAMIKKFRTGIRDVAAGAPHDYSQELDKAREAAMEHIALRAGELGANAIVGVSIDFGMSGDNARMVIVSVSGTAVAISAEDTARTSLRRVDSELTVPLPVRALPARG